MLFMTKNSFFWTHRANEKKIHKVRKDYTLDNYTLHITADGRYGTGIKPCRSYSTISSE